MIQRLEEGHSPHRRLPGTMTSCQLLLKSWSSLGRPSLYYATKEQRLLIPLCDLGTLKFKLLGHRPNKSSASSRKHCQRHRDTTCYGFNLVELDAVTCCCDSRGFITENTMTIDPIRVIISLAFSLFLTESIIRFVAAGLCLPFKSAIVDESRTVIVVGPTTQRSPW